MNLGKFSDGNLSFEVIKDDLKGGGAEYHWADFDHDGDLDLFVVSGQCSFFSNEGNDVFLEYKIPQVRIGSYTSLIDFDNDGDLDIYASGTISKSPFDRSYEQKFSVVAYNQLIADSKGIVNAAPLAPTALETKQDTAGMHLSWNAPFDDHSPTSALTYDVVIYKNGKEFSKAYFDPGTGVRHRLKQGSVSQSLLLKNLEMGEYTWKVQAVDQSFRGSAFSVEDKFFFLPPPPAINDTVIYRCGRQVTLTAKGEHIEWYADQNLTTKLAMGEFHPEASQKVYVTQTVDEVRSIAQPIDIAIYDAPDKPHVDGNNPVVICEDAVGAPVTFVAIGEQVEWYGNADKTIKLGTGTIYQTVLNPGQLYVTQTIQNCRSQAQTLQLIGITIDSRIYYDDGKMATREEAGDHYRWFKNNAEIPNSDNYFIPDPGEIGNSFTVEIQKSGCYEMSAPFIITAVEADLDNAIRIFPNPVRGDFTIQTLQGSGPIQIFDVTGNMVYESPGNATSSTAIPARNWNSGVYFVTVTYGQTRVTRKLVVL